jgi:hypothetical protein
MQLTRTPYHHLLQQHTIAPPAGLKYCATGDLRVQSVPLLGRDGAAGEEPVPGRHRRLDHEAQGHAGQGIADRHARCRSPEAEADAQR